MKALVKYMRPYFTTKKQHPLKKDEKEEYILLTYRSDIEKVVPSTYYNSDSGWGCMLRVGQMFVANLYYKVEGRSKQEVISLFYDNKPMPFSIQMITDKAAKIYPNKKPFDWFSPCECGFVIKELIEVFDAKFRVNICNDNCMFLDDIKTDREMLVIMLMCRIGLDDPEPPYLKCVLQLMKNPYFNSILGGTPKRAHLFLKHQMGYLGFLDPHTTQKVTPYEELEQREEEYISRLLWIKQKQIDCSMAVAFVVPSSEILSFWEKVEQTKAQLGQSFFIYMAKERPIFDEEEMGIIEIQEEDF